MTVFLPLEASSPFPQTPSFLIPSSDPSAHVKRVVKAIMKARRIAVVCGAGISVQAGIPDFRSSDGLFQSLKKDNPALSSGRDLFDASVFNSETTTSMFCQMMAQLYELSEVAEPTAFHKLLRALDDRGRLLRVYTQNIDALEQKSGLTFGVPEVDSKRYKPRSNKGRPDGTGDAGPSTARDPPESRLPTPPIETPKCIPLHGTVQLMHCQTCTHSFPLRDYLDPLNAGRPPYCPQCTSLEETRQLVGKRSRGVGKLRPSVVLYNEMHKDGEEVGDVVRKDLMGSGKGKGRAGADLLLVVGTSLRVPGTKRIVREFSKAVHSRSSPPSSTASQNESSTSTHGLATPTPSPRRSPAGDEEPPLRTVYLNLDFPVPTREWEGVFDVWIRGDAQEFAQMVHNEMESERQAKEAARERKRRREEAALAARLEEQLQVDKPKSTKKRKGAVGHGDSQTPVKKCKTALLTPMSLSKRSSSSDNTKPKKQTGKTSRFAKDKGSRPPEKLMIKLPPRPEVVITTRGSKRTKVASPTPPLPASPLSPLSSLPPTSKPPSPMSPPRRASSRKGRGRKTSDVLDDQEPLTDLSSDETDDYTASYLPTLSYTSRRPGG